MDFQNEYDAATDAIDDVLTSQVGPKPSWSNVVGELVKASASSAGYVWGFNKINQIYMCTVPCSGNWTQIPISGTVLDITTDNVNVYVLTNGSISIKSADNRTDWLTIPVPITANSIFSTSTYIWVQDGSNNKAKCPKPCTTGNWISVTENKIKITSSSSTALYGNDVLGNAMRTDETLQTGWAPIQGFKGKNLKSIIGDADQTALFGVDNAGITYRCANGCTDPKEIDPLDTKGYTPVSLTVEPSSRNLWMTTTTDGELGNIFTKPDSSDYAQIMTNITPYDTKRTNIVESAESEYNKQTQVMTLNKQINDIVSYFSSVFKVDKTTPKKNKEEAKKLHDKIEYSNMEINNVQSTIKILILLGTVLFVSIFLYFILPSIFGEYANIIIGLFIFGGIGYTYSYAN